MLKKIFAPKGQNAVEYLILMATVAVIVLVGFRVFLPRTRNQAEAYFNKATIGIMGASATNSLGSDKARTLATNYP